MDITPEVEKNINGLSEMLWTRGRKITEVTVDGKRRLTLAPVETNWTPETKAADVEQSASLLRAYHLAHPERVTESRADLGEEFTLELTNLFLSRR